ncbi:hypothetical protein ABPG74_021565 [Tetrahymena malaccensis]
MFRLFLYQTLILPENTIHTAHFFTLPPHINSSFQENDYLMSPPQQIQSFQTLELRSLMTKDTNNYHIRGQIERIVQKGNLRKTLQTKIKRDNPPSLNMLKNSFFPRHWICQNINH